MPRMNFQIADNNVQCNFNVKLCGENIEKKSLTSFNIFHASSGCQIKRKKIEVWRQLFNHPEVVVE
jgi:hypothetical protein